MSARVCRRRYEVVLLIGSLLALSGSVSAQSSHDCNDPFSSGIVVNCGFEDPIPF